MLMTKILVKKNEEQCITSIVNNVTNNVWAKFLVYFKEHQYRGIRKVLMSYAISQDTHRMPEKWKAKHATPKRGD